MLHVFAIIAAVLFLLITGLGLANKEQNFTCVSDAYYTLKTWFFPMMAVMAVCVLVPASLITPDDWQFTAFLMCGMIAFVGIAGDYKSDETKRKIHYASAYTSAVCSVVWTAVVCPWALLCGILAIPAVLDKKLRLLYLELACFAMVFVSLFVNI